jgi:AcrR family transcriptional regulator
LNQNFYSSDKMPKVVPEYKEIAKQKIIQASIKIFTEKGFHGATMDEIGEEIGVSKGTVYTYFKSKEELLKTIWTSSNLPLKELGKKFEGYDYNRVLEEIYRMISESHALHLSFEISALSFHNEKIKKINREIYNEKLEILTEILETQQKKLIIKNNLDANVLAQILTGLYTDVATQLLIGNDKTKVYENWKKAVTTIMKI